MKNLNTMSQIMKEQNKKILSSGTPKLNAENIIVMSQKRISIDQPASEVKQDPLR